MAYHFCFFLLILVWIVLACQSKRNTLNHHVSNKNVQIKPTLNRMKLNDNVHDYMSMSRLTECLVSVADAGPTFSRHWLNVRYLIIHLAHIVFLYLLYYNKLDTMT